MQSRTQSRKVQAHEVEGHVTEDQKQTELSAGARYTKRIASLELRHKEHNNGPYPLHNNTIDSTQ